MKTISLLSILLIFSACDDSKNSSALLGVKNLKEYQALQSENKKSEGLLKESPVEEIVSVKDLVEEFESIITDIADECVVDPTLAIEEIQNPQVTVPVSEQSKDLEVLSQKYKKCIEIGTKIVETCEENCSEEASNTSLSRIEEKVKQCETARSVFIRHQIESNKVVTDTYEIAKNFSDETLESYRLEAKEKLDSLKEEDPADSLESVDLSITQYENMIDHMTLLISHLKDSHGDYATWEINRLISKREFHENSVNILRALWKESSDKAGSSN